VTTTTLGKCVANVGGAAHGLFSAASGITAATKGCSGTVGPTGACTIDVLSVISVLSNLGSAVAHVTDQCVPKGNAEGAESADILKFVSAVSAVSSAGIAVSQNCKVSDSRLYAAEMEQKQQPSPTMNIALVALLPIAAVVGFMGGRRMSKRTTRAMHPVDEELALQQDLE